MDGSELNRRYLILILNEEFYQFKTCQERIYIGGYLFLFIYGL